MADKNQLDSGFEEVPLDEGFNEIPLDQHKLDEGFNDISHTLRQTGMQSLPFYGMEGYEPDTAKARQAQQDISAAVVNKLLFNTLPVLSGAGEAAKNAVSNLSLENLVEDYKKTRELQNKNLKQIEKEHPLAVGAGTVVGAAALSPLMPSMLAQQGAGAIPNVLKGATIGGLSGLASGTGEALSEGQDLQEGTSSALKSGLAGGFLGGTLSGAGELLKKGGSVLKNSDFNKALQKTLEGENLSSENYLPNKRSEIKEFASELTDKFKKAITDSSNEKKSILKDLTDKGVKVDTSSIVKKLSDDLNNANLTIDETQNIKNALQKIMNKSSVDSSPLQTETLIKDIRDMGRLSNSSDSYKAINDAISDIKNIQDNLDSKIPQLNKNIFQNIETSEALLKADPTEYLAAKNQGQTENYISNLIEKLQNDYKVKSNINDIIEKGAGTSKNQLTPLKELNPEIAQMLQNKAPKLSEDIRLGKAAQESIFKGSIPSMAQNVLTKGQVKLGSTIGEATKDTQDFLKDGVDILAKADGNQLQQLANKMTEIGGSVGAEYANVLKSISDKSPMSKNAMIFSLMQQPGFRELINKTKQEHVENGNED